MNKIIFFFIVLTVLSGAQVTAGGEGERRSQDPIHVVIATDATYPPMTFLDDSGEIVGFEVDLMNAAAEAGGFTCEFKNTPWDYIFTGLANGEHQAVMSSVTITEDRKSKMDFSIPYFTMEQRKIGLHQPRTQVPAAVFRVNADIAHGYFTPAYMTNLCRKNHAPLSAGQESGRSGRDDGSHER